MNAILEQINSTGYVFVEFALPMLVQSSVLIVVLLLADLLLRKKVRAVFRYWLWMLVLLKLILPTTLSSPVSLGSWFGDELAAVKFSETSTPAEPISSLQMAQVLPAEEVSTPPPVTPTAGAKPIVTPAPDTEPIVIEAAASSVVSPTPVTWQGIVFLVWATGVAAMGLLLLQRAIFVRGLIAQAKKPTELMNDAFRFCCGQMGLKGKVGLKVSAHTASPAVCGLFRPVILLPQNLAPTLGSSRLRPVLLHELAHISRGDLWVNLAQTILQIIYFYNPLLWLANSVIRRIREQAVDEAVQVAMGANAPQYPQTLVDVAKIALNRPALSLRLIGVVESKSQLKGRIKRMLTRPIPKTAKLGVLGLAAILVIGCALLPMAKAAKLKKVDQNPIGKWRSVDFVQKMEDFEPGKKSWRGELFLKDVEFMKNGGTSSFFTWKKGWIHHSNGRTKARYQIKEMDGSRYLFLPWLSGDVTIGGQKPRYYVMEEVEGNKRDESEFIAELGVMVEQIKAYEEPSEGKKEERPDIRAKKAEIAAKLATLTEHRDRVQRDLDIAERALAEVRDRWGFSDLEERGYPHPVTERLNRLQREKDDLVLEISQLQANIKNLREKEDNSNLIKAQEHSVELQARLDTLEKMLAEAEAQKRSFDMARTQYKQRAAIRDERLQRLNELKSQIEKSRLMYDNPEAFDVQVETEGKSEVSDVDKMDSENLATEGWALWRQRKLAEAENKFKEAVEKDPTNANAWNGLGWAQQNQGKPLNAKASFEKCLEIQPKHAAALNGLGWIAKAQGKTDESIGRWKKAIEAAPTATAALNGLATTYMELKQYDEAEKYYKMWLKVEPDNADAKAGLQKAKSEKTDVQVDAEGSGENRSSRRSKNLELSNDDGSSAGRESITGGGHAVRFEAPNDECTLKTVRIYGSRYGEAQAPKEDFHIWLCDNNFKVIEDFPFPYSKFKRGAPEWVMLRVKPTKLPKQFIICAGFDPHRTKGVYVHYDAQSSSNSLIALPEQPSRNFDRGDWMIRAVVTEAGKESIEPGPSIHSAIPTVVSTTPTAFANDVSPSLKTITVTFDQPMMDRSWSWTGGGDTYPETTGRPRYDSSRTTCSLPVKLEPGKVYRVGINSPSYKNFKNPNRVPAKRYVILFATKDKDDKPIPIPQDLLSKARAINQRSQDISISEARPAGRPQSTIQARGEQILKKTAEVNSYWLIRPPAKVKSYSYDFAQHNKEPKTFEVKNPSAVGDAVRQGITYYSLLHKLVAEPSAAMIIDIKENDGTIRLDFTLKDFMKIRCGNGISGSYYGSFSNRVKVGSLWLDAEKMVPVKVNAEQVYEYLSDYVAVGENHYVPLRVKIDNGDTQHFDWKFRLYEPGLWLFDESRYRVAEAEPVMPASVNNVKVNGQPAHEVHLPKIDVAEPLLDPLATKTDKRSHEQIPYTQEMFNDIQPDGAILFKTTIRRMNRSGREITNTSFINSDFVEVRSMSDAKGRPIKFTSTHEGDIYRYKATFNEPVLPGEVMEYTSKGKITGLVKRLQGKENQFQYRMTHWPAAGQPTLRIETYLLPAGAQLISTTPEDMQRGTKDGQIELHVEKMIPAGGSITTAFQYRLTGSESSSTEKTLQSLINAARPGATVTIPKGVYTEPIEVTKPLTLKGQSRADCVFEVTANKPAIFIGTKGKGRVTIENLTIKWQLATSDKNIEYPFALGVKDTKAEVKNCYFQPLGNFKRSPVAVRAMGFSNLTIRCCRFEGFEYVVGYGEGTEGITQDCLIMDCGHQGIINYSGSTLRVERNVITGSRYHAVRSTGGTLFMKDNLIINNANRGVYLGNKSARGSITNNIIMGNGTGISGFAQSKVKIENNLILDSGYAGIGMRNSCTLVIRNNIFQGNERGWILFKEGRKGGNTVYRNTFWQNKVDAENFRKTANSITAEPRFADPDNGDFSLKPGPALEHKQGLTNPKVLKTLWKIWQNRANKNEPFSGVRQTSLQVSVGPKEQN